MMAEKGYSKRKVKRDDGGTHQDYGDRTFDHPVYKQLAKLNGEINRMQKEALQTRLGELKLDTRGVKEVLKKRLKNFYKKQNLMKANVRQEAKEQLYDYYLVIDFEATCDEHNFNYNHEIIEFPIVLMDSSDRHIVDEFHEYVKPVCNPRLTAFCTQLTGITQEQVDSADTFPTVLKRVSAWFDKHHLGDGNSFALVTDGPWDMGRFMYRQCKLLSIPFPSWAKRWCNIRKAYGNFYRCRKVKLSDMLVSLGMEFEGSQHSGIDDSRNIARILKRMLQDGAAMRMNEKLHERKLKTLERVEPNDDLHFEAISSGSDCDGKCCDKQTTLADSLADLSLNNERHSSQNDDFEDLLNYYSLQK